MDSNFPRQEMPIKVIHIIPEDGYGGVETATREMASQDELSCDFFRIVLSGYALQPVSKRTVEIRGRSFLDPRVHLSAAIRAISLQPDVILCSLWRSIPTALLIKLIRPKTVLIGLLHSAERTHALDRVFHKILFKFAKEAWSDCQATSESAHRLANGRPTRVISFILSRYAPASSVIPHAHFISWSRLHHHKGLDRSLRFIKSLRDRGIDARFEIYGPDQGVRDQLETLALKLGIFDSIKFRGPISRDKLPVIAKDQSFLLQLSRQEGMGMTVVEAMQLGLIPIVTAVGEISNYCRDMKNSIIVDLDRMADSADRVSNLIQSPMQYVEIREGAIRTWAGRRLYAEDICAKTHALIAAS